MEIVFNAPKEVVIVPKQSKTIEKITILSIQDFPARKLVQASTGEIGNIILWKDAAYDAIGQWTDVDVINRINELYV